MTREKQLKQQIKAGLGAPLLREKPFGKRYDDFLLNHLFRNYAYDPQSEGPRGWYACQLLRRSGYRKRLTKNFRKQFGEMLLTDNWHNTEQAFDVAYHLFRAGKMKKGPIIRKYRQLNAKPNEYDHGWNTVIKLGRKGIRAYMEVTGRQLKGNEELTWSSREVFRHQAVRKALKRRGRIMPSLRQEKNKHIRRYRRLLDRDYPLPKAITTERAETFPDLITQIEAGRMYGRPTSLFEKLTDEELMQLARSEEKESDPLRKHMYLRVFELRPYPGDPLQLKTRLKLADARLTRTVGKIIGNVKSPAVRSLARARLGKRKTIGASIQMLAASCRESDDALIFDSIRKITNQKEVHDIGFAIQSILKRHPSYRLPLTLDFLYAQGRCGVCRRVFLLHQRAAGHLTKRRRRELPFDSYAPTRILL